MNTGIFYLYEYSNAQKLRNAGFLKITRHYRSCTLQFHARGIPVSCTDNLNLCAFYLENGIAKAAVLAEITCTSHAVSARLNAAESQFPEGRPLPHVDGFLLPLPGGTVLAAATSDAGFDTRKIQFVSSKAEPADAPSGRPASVTTQIPSKSPIPERAQNTSASPETTEAGTTPISSGTTKNDAICASPKAVETGTVSAISETPEAGTTPVPSETTKNDAICASPKAVETGTVSAISETTEAGTTLIPPETAEANTSSTSPENTEADTTSTTSETIITDTTSPSSEAARTDTTSSSSILLEAAEAGRASQNTSRESIRKIQRSELSALPRKYWSLAGNSFLMHGYHNYNHLLLIEEDGHYWLGVPGIYDARESRAAELFGFPQFTDSYNEVLHLSEDEYNPSGTFGYWCRYLK